MVYSDSRSRPLGRGRPRDPVSSENILDAAMELLVDRGYDGATIGAVASRARAGSKTIYRRYANRTEMLTAAIEARLGVLPVPNTGDARYDIRAMVSVLVESMLRGPGVSLLGTVLSEERRHPELLAAYRRHAVWPRRRLMKAVLERAQRLGEVREDVDLDVVVDQLWGAVFARYVSGIGGEGRLVDGVMDSLWRGISDPGVGRQSI